MRFLRVLTIFAAGLSGVQAQLYLITGAPTPQDDRSFASVLFEVGLFGAVIPIANLAPGTEWIAVAQDLRKAVIVPKDPKLPASVVDLDKAAVSKQCVLPVIKDMFVIENWIADVPGRGPMFEWYAASSPKEHFIQGMNLDSSKPCQESFSGVQAGDIKYRIANGAAGVANIEASDGGSVVFGQDGQLSDFLGETVDLVSTTLPAAMRRDTVFTWLVINNSRVLVVATESETKQNSRFLMFRKSDRTWHTLPAPGDISSRLRGFGRFISILEARRKKAVTEQLARHPFEIHMNDDIENKEISAGRAEWRAEDGPTGPNMEESFAEAFAVFPGRLHLYDIDTGRIYTITTNQGDSEILLVEENTLYYRVSDRLYSAPITEKGIGAAKLLATNEAIRDTHWAFIKH